MEKLRGLAGMRGKVRVRDNYLWDDVTDRIEKLYLDLVSNGAMESISARPVAAESKVAQCPGPYAGSNRAVKCRRNGAWYNRLNPRIELRFFQTSRITSTT